MTTKTAHRERTKTVRVGGVTIGGGNPVAIQSMTNTPTQNAIATAAQITDLYNAGCEIVRVSIPDMASAKALRVIRELSPPEIPIVADIHFDHALALAAMENGADGLRLNPGNIGGPEKIRQVAEAAIKRRVPIRVGVNSGSLEKDIYEKYGGVTAEGLAESALRSVGLLEGFGVEDIVATIKSSNAPLCVAATELLAERTSCPLHIGVTESGNAYSGAIKSAVGLGALLLKGIGDTIRVSLTADPLEEVRCAKEILKAAGLRQFGVEIISCPTCGRTKIDVEGIAAQIERQCADITRHIKIAVMGCVVNGPGEAKEADIGLSGGDGKGVIFRHGKIIKTLPEDRLADEIMREIRETVMK